MAGWRRGGEGGFWGKAEIGISGFLLSAFPADGGGIPRAVSNHSILYQFSMLYDSIVASVLFSASFDHF
jgi:hypothetical protein